jgi:hexosaminidase
MRHSLRHVTAVVLVCSTISATLLPAQPPAPAPIQAPAPPTLDAHRVIPVPTSVEPGTGASFALTATTVVIASGTTDASRREAARIAEYTAAIFRKSTGFRLPVTVATSATSVAPAGAIVVRIDGALASSVGAAANAGVSAAANTAVNTAVNEQYQLDITPDSLRVAAPAAAGLFRAVQTVRQLLPAGIEAEQSALRMTSTWTIPSGRIIDSPRFAWRGAMLDVARHFFTVDEVKQVIDMLALYKLNTLHLHLADDQGWRIQIDAYPKLTTVGGSTQVGAGPGGFYTKRDYAEIVRYAASRYITIVPEIDMPGHSNAAIASYPRLGCSRPTPGLFGGTQALGTYTGIRVGWSTFCADSARVYTFVNTVVRELATMTPGPYIHIGGDEVEALTPAQYAKFVGRVQDIVYQHGKTMIGWEEVGKAKLRPTSIAQFWRSDTALLALKQGAKLIMSPVPKTYLDMKYTAGTELGLRWAGYIEPRTAYEWDPASYVPGLTESAVLGVEAPLWTETVQNLTAAQYLLMPRLPALAEVGWSAQGARSWDGFATRIAAHAPRWRLLGINYYPSPQIPWVP